MSEPPLWRDVLNWGAVIYFLGIPALVIFLGFTHIQLFTNPEVGKFLANFHLSVSALVAAMAGLNSFDRYAKTYGGQAK